MQLCSSSIRKEFHQEMGKIHYIAILNVRGVLKYSHLPAVEFRIKSSFTGICHVDQFMIYSSEVQAKLALIIFTINH